MRNPAPQGESNLQLVRVGSHCLVEPAKDSHDTGTANFDAELRGDNTLVRVFRLNPLAVSIVTLFEGVTKNSASDSTRMQQKQVLLESRVFVEERMSHYLQSPKGILDGRHLDAENGFALRNLIRSIESSHRTQTGQPFVAANCESFIRLTLYVVRKEPHHEVVEQ